MSKFNVRDNRKVSVSGHVSGPIVAEANPSGATHEGAPGYARNEKSELFLLAVSNMVGEGTFYEKAGARDARFEGLVRTVALADPVWMLGFLRWLRGDANMRSASLVAAAEAVKARLDAGVGQTVRQTVRTAKPGEAAVAAIVDEVTSRQLVDAVLQRADEPGELLAYWTSRYGRAIPKPIKRGVADAVGRLYTEYALLKYDTDARGYRFADVLDLVHAPAARPEQGPLFTYALHRRHGRGNEVPIELPMITANALLRTVTATEPEALLSADHLRQAGMTWEDVLSLGGAKLDKAKLWSAIIPSMGYMALLRNLRNFDEAGLPDDVAETVAARLADPAQVAKSRQFPFRFIAAYEQAPSLRWGHALDKALQASLSNLPALPGRSLILVDTSASMTRATFSARSTMTAAKAAATFGVALAAKGENVDLRGFADGVFTHQVPRGGSVLKETARFIDRTGEVGHGTQIAQSVRSSYAGHDRVFIISDMQTMDRDVTGAVPANIPLYGFNLGGYRYGALPAGSVPNRHEFGGLTDATFRMVPLLEAGQNATWPWLDNPAAR